MTASQPIAGEQGTYPAPSAARREAPLPILDPAAQRMRTLVMAAGVVLVVYTGVSWSSPDLIQYAVFLAAALVLASAKLTGAGGHGVFSASLLFVLFGIHTLTGPEVVYLAAFSALTYALAQRDQCAGAVNAISHVSITAMAAAAAHRSFDSPLVAEGALALRLATALLVLFLINTSMRAWLVALDEGRKVTRTWMRMAMSASPYYMVAGVGALLMDVAADWFGWETSLLSVPAVYLIYRSYRLYVHRLEDQKKHAEEMAALHLRTIEALALAIEAKDTTTHDHLRRVQVYAEEMSEALGLTAEERQALQAAAVLHDIGKLAVPEHIISKPGRLTPEEFEKMKIHPIVGAEILERVRFPYPVAPIVRAHHEKWDGSGYPNGLKGEDIPIGARILAAVDCLDALASDRQYRRALPLEQAMDVVRKDAGSAFDPRVVDALAANYVEWERKAQKPGQAKQAKLSTEVKVELGAAPAAGFESARASAPAGTKEQPMDFLTSIAAARQEVQTLFEISQDLGSSLSLDETLSVLNVRLRRIIPHHSLAIWLRQGDILKPAYVNGEDYRLFSSLEIPMGQGLSGWVAENGKPIVNGNPSVEPGYLNDPTRCSMLRSAVAVPLEGQNGTVGVLSLYHMERDAFTRDHLRVLTGISPKIGMAIENALKFSQVTSSATTDYMTSLPNARSLFLHLDAEMARARRGNTPLTVMVIDMDGLKLINDRFGHLEGNRILSAVAAGLKSACREYDYVARMGGDEFVLLIPGLKGAGAHTRIEDLRRVIAQAGAGLFPDQPLTASIGVATFPEDGQDAEKLLAEADRRMYAEKRERKEVRMKPPKMDWSERLATVHVQ